MKAVGTKSLTFGKVIHVYVTLVYAESLNIKRRTHAQHVEVSHITATVSSSNTNIPTRTQIILMVAANGVGKGMGM